MLGRSRKVLGATASLLLIFAVADCSDDESEPAGVGGATSTGSGGADGGTTDPGGSGGMGDGGTGDGGTGATGGEGGGGASAPECDEPESNDPDCEDKVTGAWCWDGGLGGDLFCGCDPAWEAYDCVHEGYEACNPTTFQCEPPPDCGGDANEDNNDEGSATALTMGTPISGATCGYDPDFFTFQATTNAALVTASWTDDGGTDLDLAITDCAGNYLASGQSVDPAQEALKVVDLTVGTSYCVLVDHYEGDANGDDVAYDVVVNERTACVLDSQCTGSDVCPFYGDEAGLCAAPPPPNAGCGDAVAGDNETSSVAEALTSGVPINEGTCDGNPNNSPDVDWFTFTVTAGDQLALGFDQNSGLADGDVDVLVYDSTGELWAGSATEDNPESIQGAGLPAGTYYAVIYYYDLDSQTPASTTYDATLTLTAGTGCADRDDCAGFLEHGECTANVCEPFLGNGQQGPGEFCDSPDDCDPNTTGSVFTSSPCFTADGTLGTDNVCVIDCTSEADCTPHGMHCLIVQDPDGICLAPCLTDAGCGGGTCDPGTGICSF